MMWSSLKALLWRDITLARNQGGGLGAALAFILAVIVLVPIAIGPDPVTLRRIGAGMMWLSLLLSVLLTAERIFQQDLEDGSLELMTMTRAPFELITLTKATAHWLTVALPLAVIAPPLGLMLNMELSQLPMLWLSMITGSLALSLLASLGGAIAAGLRRGGLLIAILTLPLYIPVLIFGVATSSLMMGPQSPWPALAFLMAMTLFCVVICPIAAAAALRAYIR